MSFQTMTQEILGVPGMNFALAQTKINEALQLIYDEQLWSFQLKENGWLTPGLLGGNSNMVSPGLITVAPYSTVITGNATASAAWIANTLPLLTQQQIRVPYYSLYNIIAVDTTVPTAVKLTIDRPWMEPSQTLAEYMIYQAYFPVPVSDFKRFWAVRDTTNNNRMDFWSYTQRDLAFLDAQRTNFDNPCFVVAYEVDQRPGSATYGNMLYELWPQPLSILPYSYSYVRTGPSLALPGDTPPYPLNDEVVKWRAYEQVYLWKESQKGDDLQRGSGADWRFLTQSAHAEYARRLRTVSMKDRDLVEMYTNQFERDSALTAEPYATINGQLNIGRF
jgi:hypothetical protein